jgi:hypothetical protein
MERVVGEQEELLQQSGSVVPACSSRGGCFKGELACGVTALLVTQGSL